jgi:hypothetical protein
MHAVQLRSVRFVPPPDVHNAVVSTPDIAPSHAVRDPA